MAIVWFEDVAADRYAADAQQFPRVPTHVTLLAVRVVERGEGKDKETRVRLVSIRMHVQ